MAALKGNTAGRIVAVIGPPCSGKGTQCKRLAEQFGFVHLSTGDVFREAVEQNTEFGQQAKEYVEQGSFMPDDMVISFIQDRLKQPDIAASGCLLDGFPRTGKQANALNAAVSLDRVLQFEVPDDVLVKRAPDRRQDPETGAIYNLQTQPPPADVVDRLVVRDRDNDEASFKMRLDAYNSRIRPTLKEVKKKVIKIDATRAPDDVFASVITGLNQDLQDDDEWSDEEPEPGLPCGSPVPIEVAPIGEVGGEGGEQIVGISIKVPDDTNRVPVDVCCVIDTSGSMGSAAKPANADEDGDHVDTGLSVLDIVKHAVKTAIAMLGDDDRLSIVNFHSQASTAYELSNMSAEGREAATKALEALHPGGQTNIWDGILKGLESLRDKEATSNRRKTVLLLTDGQPNMQPPEGHIPALQKYQECHTDLRFQLNTFGFGYNLDSKLLEDLAGEGRGTFAFIPDAVLVGTCFVNSMANAMSTWVQDAKVHLMLQNGAEFQGPVIGEYTVNEASWGRIVSVGPLTLGQTRDLALPLKVPPGEVPYLEVALTYTFPNGQEGRALVQATSRQPTNDANMARLRNHMVHCCFQAIRDAEDHKLEKAEKDVAGLVTFIEDAATKCTDPRLEGLRSDVGGRMSKALQGMDRFNRWGKHYLRALARGHELQLCTNFMDPGVQVYGGSLFATLRTRGDEAFLSLPPPQPSRKPVQTSSGGGSSAPAPQTNMQTYYAGAGGG